MNVFGSRLFNPASILYLVQGKASVCNDIVAKFPARFLIDVVFLYLADNFHRVERAEAKYICTRCRIGNCYGLTATAILNTSIAAEVLNAKLIVAKLKDKYIKPVVAALSKFSEAEQLEGECEFLYKMTALTRPDRIGCVPTHLLIENAAANLNYSVHYLHERFANSLHQYEGSGPMHYAAVSYLRILSWIDAFNEAPNSKILSQISNGDEIGKFFYCEKVV